ncbi:MAG: threonine--tRNA ligase [Candidatus Peregrinibacteria bacterium]|nr:threonine--tRNA ligase [Candidatus Peregrinibacteria bacterium]
MNDLELRRRHTAAHIMTKAVKMMFPEVKLGVGPAIEDGFYQDFDFGDEKISDEIFKKIEKKMRWIINKDFKIEKKTLSEKEAREAFADDPYKNELIDDVVAKGEDISFYDIIDGEGNPFYRDVCAGPHLNSTGEVGAFKITRIAGAYWRGDEKNKMLTRLYGVAFADKEGIEQYEEMMREAAKRDHRKLGKELELFTFDEEVGSGLPLWLPAGAEIVERLERLAKETEERFDYKRVRSPHIAKEKLYLKSGHLPYYAEDMFPPMEIDNEKYYLKAMNCPHHHKIYDATPKSYKDLPLRFAEYGHCYRHEDSGSLFGLMRVRSLCMNDAHIYCTDDQFEEEFQKVIQMYLYYFDLFGIEKYQMRLSKHSKEGLGKKYVDEPELWIKTEDQVRKALQKLNVPFVEAEDEGAFYGPKIDVQIWSAIGREFTLATNQLDFAVPARFNLTYVDKDGKEKTPICIHRAPLSTHERMIGFLLEHYAGALPAWMAPTQAAILPVSEKHLDFANEVFEKIRAARGRVKTLDTSETLGKRIRQAQTQKIPYSVVIGDEEVKNKNLTIRLYGEKKDVKMSVDEFLEKIKYFPTYKKN